MNRLIFANQLRGVAALGVALSHLIGVYWLMQDYLASVTMAPEQGGPLPLGPLWLVTHQWFNFGPFGVGLFFLISGLVIPFSLERHTRLSFLAARVLRIYPTYVAALAIELAVLYAASRYWHRPFAYDFRTIGMNALLVYNYVGVPSIDLVNWTLCIELKFYVVMALCAPLILSCSVAVLFAIAAALLAAIMFLQPWITPDSVAGNFSTEAIYLTFMLIGVLFNYRLRERLSASGLIAGVAWLLVMMVLIWQRSAIAAQVPVVTVNYLYALALFGALFFLRRFARPFAPLDAMADISFPFYLVHSMLGYSVMKLLMIAWHVPYIPAALVAFTVGISVALVLHRLVERPTMLMGKSFAHPLSPSRAAVPKPMAVAD